VTRESDEPITHHLHGSPTRGFMELNVFESPGQEWDEFASRYTDLIFYQSVWSQVLKEGLGGQPLYFCLRNEGEIVAGLPAVLLNFSIFKILYASIPYGNLIGERSYFPFFVELLEKEFHRRGIDQVRITESPFSESFPPESFKPISTKSTLLDLRGYDKIKIWEGYKKNIRRDIRKAQRSGIRIRRGASGKDANIFYKLYLASMERNRAMAKYPLRWFETLYEVLTEKELSAIYVAELNDVPIAGVVLIYSVSSTHYFHNGSQYEFLKFCPNELLVHSSIENAVEREISFFDFMGSDPKDLSLLRFKEKWGGQSMNLNTYVNDYHPFRCRILEMGKKFSSSKMGSSLVKILRT
jgi:serine/alanine adding enzyme